MQSPIPHWKMHDSAYPPSRPLPGFRACAGYIGGDTPHVWTFAEWQRFKGFPKLPIYVNDGIGGQASDGERDAWNALDQLYRLNVPPGSAIAYDIEARIANARVQGFRNVVEHFGYPMWLYGSISTVFKNSAANYWPAHYGVPDKWPTRNSRAFQYENSVKVPGEPDIDVSRIRWWQVLNGLWK